MKVTSLTSAIVLTFLLLNLSACGQYGPLYLPTPQKQAQSSQHLGK